MNVNKRDDKMAGRRDPCLSLGLKPCWDPCSFDVWPILRASVCAPKSLGLWEEVSGIVTQ